MCRMSCGGSREGRRMGLQCFWSVPLLQPGKRTLGVFPSPWCIHVGGYDMHAISDGLQKREMSDAQEGMWKVLFIQLVRNS